MNAPQSTRSRNRSVLGIATSPSGRRKVHAHACIAGKSIGGGVVAIAFATAFAGCQCSVNEGQPPQNPAKANAPAALVVNAPASPSNPPKAAPLPPSLRAQLGQHDGGV